MWLERQREVTGTGHWQVLLYHTQGPGSGRSVTASVQCPQRPGEDIGAPGIGVTGGCEPPHG